MRGTSTFRNQLRVVALVAGALVLAACGGGGSTSSSSAASSSGAGSSLIDSARCERNRAAGTITYISGYGYSASAGQLDVFVAKQLGYFDQLCLKVEINASGANGQQLVAANQAQFTSLGSASDVMLSAANSKNLKAIATYGTQPPFAIFANEKIKSLKDLEGGTLGYFINLTPIASAMLEAAGVDVSKVKLVKMTNYDPTVVPRGQVDAIVGYASNQVQTLRAMNLPFTEFLPEQFGVNGTYNVAEVNTQFLEKNRAVAADFMRAGMKAAELCLADEAQCVDIVAKLAAENNQGAAFPEEQLARTWKVESQWVRDSAGGDPGVQTAAMWQPEYELVQKYTDAKLPPLADMMDNELVAGLYQDGKLQWPGQ